MGKEALARVITALRPTTHRISLFSLLAACFSFPTLLAARPSVLLVTIDTLRADHVTQELTPHLWELGEQSVVFEQAITVSPLTLVSHASLLTGLLPMNHGIRDNSFFVLGKDVPTFPQFFRDQGYQTAAFVSSIVLDSTFGLDAGFDHYDDDFKPPERSSQQTLERALAWVDRVSGPFFLWIHLFDPHAPYQGSYSDEVRRADRNLGHFFSQLQQRNLWKDLIVAVTSDHGESLGEHGEKTHGFFVYDSTLHVPLILKAPGLKAGTFPYQVSLVDVLPTILEFVEFPADLWQQSGIQPDGRGLRSDIQLHRDPERTVYSETFLPRHQFNWSELRSLRTPAWKYIEAPKPELYALDSDPSESRNLWTQANPAAIKLAGRLERLGRGRGEKQSSQASHFTAERFMSLGYIGYSPPEKEESSPDLPDPKDELGTYLLVMDAIELSERRQPEQALGKLKEAEKNDPNVTQIHFLEGSILGGIGRFPEAIRALEKTLALNPRYVTGRFKLAQAYLASNQLEEAQKTLQVALEQDPGNYRAYHNLAVIAVRQGNLAEAERLERQALELDDSYFEAWNALGAIQISSQRPQPARDALLKALALKPDSGQAYYNLSLAEKALGNLNAAVEAASKACQLDSRYCYK